MADQSRQKVDKCNEGTTFLESMLKIAPKIVLKKKMLEPDIEFNSKFLSISLTEVTFQKQNRHFSQNFLVSPKS